MERDKILDSCETNSVLLINPGNLLLFEQHAVCFVHRRQVKSTESSSPRGNIYIRIQSL